MNIYDKVAIMLGMHDLLPSKIIMPVYLITGYEPIDEEHRQIFARVNTYAHAIETQNEWLIERCHQFFRSYARTHFEHEDAIMQRIHYDAALYDQHLRAHSRFWLHMEKIKEPGHRTKDTLDFMLHWLEGHINHQDRQLCQVLLRDHPDFVDDHPRR